MITEEQAEPGTPVLYTYEEVTQEDIVEGSYIDDRLGLMIKSRLFPGGMPAERYSLPGQSDIAEALPAVTFEVAIIDEKEPVKITASLIREKSKALTDLTIASIFDDKGYEAVKKALSSKAVKTRTGIEKKEKEVLTAMKTRHTAEIKEVTDYTAELYTVCREVEKNLRDKLTTIDDAKAVEAKRIEDEAKAKTQVRENKMYELGMAWNGQQFVGFGKMFFKESLDALPDDRYTALVEELESLQMEQSITGVEKPVAATVETIRAPRSFGGGGASYVAGVDPYTENPEIQAKLIFPTAIYDITVEGIRFVLTRGECIELNPEIFVKINERVAQSAIFCQVFKTENNTLNN